MRKFIVPVALLLLGLAFILTSVSTKDVDAQGLLASVPTKHFEAGASG